MALVFSKPALAEAATFAAFSFIPSIFCQYLPLPLPIDYLYISYKYIVYLYISYKYSHMFFKIVFCFEKYTKNIKLLFSSYFLCSEIKNTKNTKRTPKWCFLNLYLQFLKTETKKTLKLKFSSRLQCLHLSFNFLIIKNRLNKGKRKKISYSMIPPSRCFEE